MKNLNVDHAIDNLIELVSNKFQPEFFKGLARFAYELNIDGNKLFEEFSYEYMKYIYENVSKTKADIMSHTGYRRTTVENFKKKYESSKIIPQVNKTNNIYKEFIHKLKTACLENKDNSLPIYGQHSCHSIFLDSKINDKTYTLKSVLSVLEKSGLIEINDISIIFKPQIIENALRSNDDLNRQFSNVVNDFTNTQIHNKNEDEHEKRLFSIRTDSVEVPDNLISLTSKQLNQILRDANKASFDRLEKNETHGEQSNCSYRIGVQQYVFVTKRNEE